MNLSILMPALTARSGPMRSQIEAQIAEQAGSAEVEFLIEEDNGELPCGTKRQRLLERAVGDYVAFVDDDDEVAPNYLKEILIRCDGIDVVTFNLEMIRKGRPPERWKFGLHPDYRPSGRMSANHLCAWRRDIARRVAFCPTLRYADDQTWYKPLLAAGYAQFEHHVDQVLYRYLFDADVTVCQQPEHVKEAKKYAAAGLRVFRLGDEVFVEEPLSIVVRDSCNRQKVIPRDMLELVTSITVD